MLLGATLPEGFLKINSLSQPDMMDITIAYMYGDMLPLSHVNIKHSASVCTRQIPNILGLGAPLHSPRHLSNPVSDQTRNIWRRSEHGVLKCRATSRPVTSVRRLCLVSRVFYSDALRHVLYCAHSCNPSLYIIIILHSAAPEATDQRVPLRRSSKAAMFALN